MNIIVCIKQVPDTTDVKIDPVKGSLIRTGIPNIMNPDDKAGLEAALRLKDQMGAKVTALSMGPAQADAVLREALAMGADEAFLLTDRAFGGADTWATSSTLAAAIRTLPYDLIITGRQAIDGDTAQVGPQIAEHLGLPNVSYAEKIKIEGDHVTATRLLDNNHQVVKMKMPCLVTALPELADPRYMTTQGIFDAYRKQTVHILTRNDIEIDDANLGLRGSPTRVIKSFTKQQRGEGVVVEMDTNDAADFIIEKMQEKFVL